MNKKASHHSISHHSYARLTPRDFDKYNCVNLSTGIYMMLAFLLRGYLIWVMSVTNLKNGTSFLTWVYPESFIFYLSLISGSIGLFIILVMTLRRPDAPEWVKRAWHHINWWFYGAIAFDFTITVWFYFIGSYIALSTIVIHLVIVLTCLLYIIKNQRFNLNLTEFPEHFTEAKTKG